jgi:hypothetical protein
VHPYIWRKRRKKRVRGSGQRAVLADHDCGTTKDVLLWVWTGFQSGPCWNFGVKGSPQRVANFQGRSDIRVIGVLQLRQGLVHHDRLRYACSFVTALWEQLRQRRLMQPLCPPTAAGAHPSIPLGLAWTTTFSKS